LHKIDFNGLLLTTANRVPGFYSPRPPFTGQPSFASAQDTGHPVPRSPQPRHSVDRHSKRLIISNIELFLNYCIRFYDRQFIIRENAHAGVLAKERIFDESKSVSQIAYDLGFKYPQHFIRVFKQHVGTTPSEYRSLD
jgi:AraC-like DNA-binding protein